MSIDKARMDALIDQADTIPCPYCHGAKVTVAAHVSYADGTHGYGVPFPCDRCNGDGVVPAVMLDWIARGKKMRERRVHGTPYRNLHEEATRRGLDVVTLSRMERGIIEPVEQ